MFSQNHYFHSFSLIDCKILFYIEQRGLKQWSKYWVKIDTGTGTSRSTYALCYVDTFTYVITLLMYVVKLVIYFSIYYMNVMGDLNHITFTFFFLILFISRESLFIDSQGSLALLE